MTETSGLYLTSTGHDFDSALCRERAARERPLSPEQRRPAEYVRDCPACDLHAAPS